MVRFRADGVLALGIEDDEVSVAADGDGSFARVEAEEFGGSGGDQFDETIRRRSGPGQRRRNR